MSAFSWAIRTYLNDDDDDDDYGFYHYYFVLAQVLRVSSGVTNISIDADEKEIVFHIISICPSVGETTSSQHAD